MRQLHNRLILSPFVLVELTNEPTLAPHVVIELANDLALVDSLNDLYLTRTVLVRLLRGMRYSVQRVAKLADTCALVDFSEFTLECESSRPSRCSLGIHLCKQGIYS
jgi:hypothetical protein